nr:hypothetical protein [Tanacetum cinerariifolium]
MNYLEEQTDDEVMINSIQNGDQPLPVVAQVSLAGTAQNAPPTLKDPKKAAILYEYDTFKAIEGEQLLDTYLRYLQMRSSEYGKQDRKAVILYEYETFKAIEGEQLLDTYLRYLQVINDLKKCGYKKDNCELNYKFLNNLQQEWKQYATLMRTSSTSQSTNKKQEFVKSNDKKEDKKADEKKRDMSKVKCYNCKKEGHFAKDCKKAKDQAWMESSSDSNQEINANMVFMAQIKKVLSESEESSSSAEETIAEVAYYTSESESESEFETSE